MSNDQNNGTPASPPSEPDPGKDPLSAGFDEAYGKGVQTDGEARPVIQWKAGNLPDIVDQAEAALLRGGRHDVLFQRGPSVVRVTRRQAMSVRTFKRPAGGLSITQVDKPYMVEQLTRAARWQKWDGRKEDYVDTNAPELVASTYLSRSGHWRLPRLLAAISAPTLRPDGTVQQAPGYDEATASWYDPCGIEFPAVPEKPTRRQAEAAKNVLLESIESIPFEALTDASVAVSLMLTSLVRRSLPSAPMGAITAPTPGSGKTLLADCISILATGVAAASMSYPSSDEEAEKVALSLLMDGDPVVLIDNIERPLQGAWLCTVLTSETYQGRMLGRNEMISVPTTTLWLANGNKLVIQGDLRTRTLLCRIDPKHENPERREFKVDLREYFAKHRAKLVHAGLTLMRAYITGGERASVWRPWGRFEHWSRFCREPLMWMGWPDPCDSYHQIADEDPERIEHLQMLTAWTESFKDRGATAKEAIEVSGGAGHELLRDMLHEIAKDRSGALSAKRLAGWLRNRAGRIVGGRMFEKAGETRADVSLWRVKEMKS